MLISSRKYPPESKNIHFVKNRKNLFNANFLNYLKATNKTLFFYLNMISP